jgi:hypothetical protein
MEVVEQMSINWPKVKRGRVLCPTTPGGANCYDLKPQFQNIHCGTMITGAM